jgi:hypothetical protein
MRRSPGMTTVAPIVLYPSWMGAAWLRGFCIPWGPGGERSCAGRRWRRRRWLLSWWGLLRLRGLECR